MNCNNEIKNSQIHPHIKDILLGVSVEQYSENGSYEFESDFMFGFIESLISRGYCKNDPEDNGFEVLCYKWCIKYFKKYLNGLNCEIFTESEYPLYTQDGTYEGEELEDWMNDMIYSTNQELDLTLDYNILNNITGKLYFDE